MDEFIEKIGNLKNTYTRRDYRKLGFSLDIPDELLFSLLKKGWWHNYFIGYKFDNGIGLRISPDSDYQQWPVTTSFEGNNSVTIAPNLANIYGFRKLTNYSDPEVIDELSQEDIDIVKNKIIDFLELVNGVENYDYFTNYFMDKNNYPDTEEKALTNYINIWNHADQSYGHQFLRETIDKLKQDENILIDEVDTEKLGYWKSRVLYLLVQRVSKLNTEIDDNPKLEKIHWELFSGLHVYDCEKMSPQHIPNEINSPKSEFQGCVGNLGLNLDKRSDYIKESPLFPALQVMRDEYFDTFSIRKYIGVQHMEAAAYYDSELDDPIKSWNCLVNAAYWSGVNAPETLLPAWEAAIYLAEKRGWKDVHTALTTQYEFYKAYKAKNNIS